jgi:hypothetical protein
MLPTVRSGVEQGSVFQNLRLIKIIGGELIVLLEKSTEVILKSKIIVSTDTNYTRSKSYI